MMEGFKHEYYESDESIQFTLFEIAHSFNLVRCIIWVVTFPAEGTFIFTDCLN